MVNQLQYRPPSVTLATLPIESKLMAVLWMRFKDWKMVQQEALEHHHFPQKSLKGQKRVMDEVRFRLQHLRPVEIELMVELENMEEIRLLVHLAACRAYPLLLSFSRQVLREKLMVFDEEVQDADFHNHWEEQAVLHDSLYRLGETSRSQIRRAVYRFLAEVGVLIGVPPRTLNPVHPPSSLVQGIDGSPQPWLEALLLDEATIEMFLQENPV